MWLDMLYGSYLAVATEYGTGHGIADVFAITRSMLTHEVEVKCSRSDLQGELQSIQAVLSGSPQERGSKYWKHWYHLKDPVSRGVPNRFSFLVPTSLEHCALAGLKNTPYGLYVISDQFFINKALTPGLLHHEKIDERTLKTFIRKVSTENQVVREKLETERQAHQRSRKLLKESGWEPKPL